MHVHLAVLPRWKVIDCAVSLPAFCILLLMIPWWVFSRNLLTLIYSSFLGIILSYPKFLSGSVRHVRCYQHHSFLGRSSSVNVRSVTLKTCYNPIYRITAEDFPQNPSSSFFFLFYFIFFFLHSKTINFLCMLKSYYRHEETE